MDDQKGASAPARGNPEPWLALLAFLLVVWQPLSFAVTASAALDRVVSYGAPALLLLGVRVWITGLGIAAGRALWTRRPHARRLTLWFLALASLATLATASTPYFPSNRTATAKRLAVTAVLVHNAAWSVLVARSRSLRDPTDDTPAARRAR